MIKFITVETFTYQDFTVKIQRSKEGVQKFKYSIPDPYSKGTVYEDWFTFHSAEDAKQAAMEAIDSHTTDGRC